MFITLVQVALGGAIGASFRYVIGYSVSFPFGTLTVNIVGSFLMGLAFVGLPEKEMARWMPFIMTGILGGFTTFSAFSLDVYRLFDAGRVLAAGGYVLASVSLSIVALFAGVLLMRAVHG